MEYTFNFSYLKYSYAIALCLLLIPISETLQAEIISEADLVQAVQEGNYRGVRSAIDSGMSVKITGGRFSESLLNHASENGHQKIVKLLIRKGADVNRITGIANGMTPLIRASLSCHSGIVKILVGKGANPNQTNKGSLCMSPLHAAASRGCESTVRFLLKRKADVNFAGGCDGSSVWHTVLTVSIVTQVNTKTSRLLIKAGANVNQKAYGDSPLHHAIEHFPIISNYAGKRHNSWTEESFKLIRLLLKSGARTDIKSEKGLGLIAFTRDRFKNSSHDSRAGKTYYKKVEKRLIRLLKKYIKK